MYLPIYSSDEYDGIVIFFFLANVSSRSRSLLCRRLSVGRLSVCRLKRSCALLRRLKLSAMFLRHLVLWPSVDFRVRFYGNRPRGTPLSGGVKH